jgi:hypothetical protein
VTAFDFSHIAAPFRMQPGLRRLAAGEPQLTPLSAGTPLWMEKQAVLQAGESRHAVPGFDAQPALQAIAQEAQWDPAVPLELAFEEDIAVLEGADATLPWLCVCVPSHWAPEDKLGLPFAAVHAPVADNAALLAASRQLVQLATSGDRFERFVWTLTPSGRYDQHPRRHPREPWPVSLDDAAFAQRCFLRSERQTFLPVGRGTRQAVFTIRVMLQPLAQAVDTPDRARRLHDALASMSEAVLAYKGLAAARDPLLRWLAGRSA